MRVERRIMETYPDGYPENYVDDVYGFLEEHGTDVLEFFRHRYTEDEQRDLIIAFLRDGYDGQQDTEQEIIDASVWAGFNGLRWSLLAEAFGGPIPD